MQKSTIQWTEKTWNPISGCSKISQGCKNCYAETIANRFWKDRKFTDIICHEDRLQQPLSMKKPAMIFVNSMSDLFHEKVPAEFIIRIFRVMQTAQWHTFQILTKRAQRMSDLIAEHNIYVPKNIWLGVSVENQNAADERISLLLETEAVVRWLSVEPMIDSIDLSGWLSGQQIDWLVCGAESGHGARPMENEWALTLLKQCKESQTPFFMKQLCDKRGKKIDYELFPKELQVREYPQ